MTYNSNFMLMKNVIWNVHSTQWLFVESYLLRRSKIKIASNKYDSISHTCVFKNYKVLSAKLGSHQDLMWNLHDRLKQCMKCELIYLLFKTRVKLYNTLYTHSLYIYLFNLLGVLALVIITRKVKISVNFPVLIHLKSTQIQIKTWKFKINRLLGRFIIFFTFYSKLYYLHRVVNNHSFIF